MRSVSVFGLLVCVATLWVARATAEAAPELLASAGATEAEEQVVLETPESASLLLLGSGLIFTAAQIRRRARPR